MTRSAFPARHSRPSECSFTHACHVHSRWTSAAAPGAAGLPATPDG